MSTPTTTAASGKNGLEALPVSGKVNGEFSRFSDFPGVEVKEAVGNRFRGMTSKFIWTPVRGQEGRQYLLCVTVVDACKAGVAVERCVFL